MTDTTRITLCLAAWVGTISFAHVTMNVDWSAAVNNRLPEAKRKLNVAFIPVT